MTNFYLTLWVRWSIAFIVIGLLGSLGFATVVTAGIYIFKGFVPLNTTTWNALQTIWFFWLSIGYGVGMIAALVVALNTLLYRCINHRRLILLNCKEEVLERSGFKPYFKLWRKWFFSLIWINAAQVIIVIIMHKLLFGGSVWIGWFNPWSITLMILLSGGVALPLMIHRSKRLKIVPCS